MSQLQDRIAQFRKMANDDPDNELGHYRLGQLLMEDKQYAEAVQSFRRTLELSPTFSKVYHLLALALLNDNQRDEAVARAAAGLRRGRRARRQHAARRDGADAGGAGRAGPGVEAAGGAGRRRRRRLPLPAAGLSDGAARAASSRRRR